MLPGVLRKLKSLLLREQHEDCYRYESFPFTHDLDFGAILAATDANSPSVFQIRTQDVSSKTLSPVVLSVLKQFEERLNEGALVTVNEKQARARLLPLKRH